jgi:hypothetical protein
MTPDELFDVLDPGSDGELSRTDLLRAAHRLGWHWREAPFFAVLDHFTTAAPLCRQGFVDLVDQIVADRLGPFGRVLLGSPVHSREITPASDREHPPTAAGRAAGTPPDAGFVELLRRVLDSEAADDYQALVESVGGDEVELRGQETAILLIDPQVSFTSGTWRDSIGPEGNREVEPLRLAFANCGILLEACGGHVETMFTRCPFPPDSYGWDERVADFVDERQLYFVKPGNSALWPPTNGVREWLEALSRANKRTLVVGGCTLNSCVRVSAIELQRRAEEHDLQVLVDLSLCGARLENYARSPEFGGRSSVQSAVREMAARGVLVRSQVVWSVGGAGPSG